MTFFSVSSVLGIHAPLMCLSVFYFKVEIKILLTETPLTMEKWTVQKSGATDSQHEVISILA